MSLDRKINRIQFLSGNSLKVIAVLTMLIDHLCNTILPTKYSAFLVENSGIEPLTSCMPCKRSPS